MRFIPLGKSDARLIEFVVSTIAEIRANLVRQQLLEQGSILTPHRVARRELAARCGGCIFNPCRADAKLVRCTMGPHS